MTETIAIVFSLISTYQAYRKSIWNWVTGIIGIIAYFIIFKEDKNWANMLLQIVFIVQYVYGWLVWDKDDTKVSFSSTTIIIKQVVMIFLLCILCYFINTLFHGSLSVLDATTTALSVVAMVLLAHKKIENWVYFIIADILYVLLFISSKHIGSCLLYAAFGILSVMALFKWGREIKKNENA